MLSRKTFGGGGGMGRRKDQVLFLENQCDLSSFRPWQRIHQTTAFQGKRDIEITWLCLAADCE